MHALANLAAGKAHLKGRGAEKIVEMAIPFILSASDAGNAEAQYHLAELAYMEYLEEDQRDGKSHEDFYFLMMHKSAEQNYLPAIHGLGIHYELKNEYRLAAECYRKSAEQGLPIAQRHLAEALLEGRGIKRDVEEAKHWYTLAAEGKDKTAIKHVANWDEYVMPYEN